MCHLKIFVFSLPSYLANYHCHWKHGWGRYTQGKELGMGKNLCVEGLVVFSGLRLYKEHHFRGYLSSEIGVSDHFWV